MQRSRSQAILIQLIRDLRLEAGLTQEQLGKRLGRGQPFVSKYESGERRVDMLEMREICTVLGTDLGEFVKRLERALEAAGTGRSRRRQS